MQNMTCIVLEKGDLKKGTRKVNIDDLKLDTHFNFLSSNIIKFEADLPEKSYDLLVKSIEEKFNCKLLLIKTREENKVHK